MGLFSKLFGEAVGKAANDMMTELKKTIEKETEKKPPVSVAAERYRLTAREETVLRLMMDGLENGEIAEKLSISVNTLKKHILSIYRKIGVRDRIGLFKAIREKEF